MPRVKMHPTWALTRHFRRIGNIPTWALDLYLVGVQSCFWHLVAEVWMLRRMPRITQAGGFSKDVVLHNRSKVTQPQPGVASLVLAGLAVFCIFVGFRTFT